MQASSSFKKSLLKNMLVGLQVESSIAAATKNTTLLERKRAIKLTSDIAMAFARGRGANWSRALIANLLREEKNKLLIRRLLGRDNQGLVKSKRILKRSLLARRLVKRGGSSSLHRRATSIARRMVLKKTRVLKSLVPGGRSAGDYPSLLGETLDYVVFLRAQVDMMRRLMEAVEVFNRSSCPTGSGDVHQ